jgi:pSer/pThr/pTyr-binding forkhead associated (FHA) protein
VRARILLIGREPESRLPCQDETSGDRQPTAGRLVSLPNGKAYVIGLAPLTIGRGPSSDIPVHSEEVSRSHAYLIRTPKGFLLVDSSLHGTYINGERVKVQRLLSHGDVVQIGSRSFRFDLDTV